MISNVGLPWWAWLYLLLVMGTFVAGFFAEEKFDNSDITSSVFSFFSICVFVIGFFNPSIPAFLGYLIIPMTFIGMYAEFTRAVIETRLAEEELSKDNDLDDSERKFLLNFAIALNAFIVVPGYAMGLILCINVLGLT